MDGWSRSVYTVQRQPKYLKLQNQKSREQSRQITSNHVSSGHPNQGPMKNPVETRGLRFPATDSPCQSSGALGRACGAHGGRTEAPRRPHQGLTRGWATQRLHISSPSPEQALQSRGPLQQRHLRHRPLRVPPRRREGALERHCLRGLRERLVGPELRRRLPRRCGQRMHWARDVQRPGGGHGGVRVCVRLGRRGL